MLFGRYEADHPHLNMYLRDETELEGGIQSAEELRAKLIRLGEELEGEPHAIIKAKAFAYVLDNAAILVNPRGWFGVHVAGLRFGGSPKGINKQNPNSGGVAAKPLHVLSNKWKEEALKDAPASVKAAMDNMYETGAGSFWPDYDHSVPDWDAVLRYGFAGLKERARARRAELKTLTSEQRAYFDSIDITYASLIRFMLRLADYSHRHAREDAKFEKREKCFMNLAQGAPNDIYEAMQLIYLFHLIQQYLEAVQARSFGDLDRLLYPYYEKALETGEFTREQIKELFMYLFAQYDYQNHPYNQPMAIGGIDEHGEAIANDLSGLICDAYYDADVVNLKIFVVTSEKTPDWLIKKTLEHVRGNHGSYVYVNADKAAEIMSRSRGIQVEPCKVGTWGCFNLNVKGGTTDCLHVRLNAAKPIELALNRGIDPATGARIGIKTAPAEEISTFEAFERAFYAQLDAMTDKAIEISTFYDERISDILPAPMDSATLDYSLERAQDAFSCGVTNVCLSCAGTAADSLNMVKKYVYERRALTLAELRDALKRNWEGYEKLRLEIARDGEKYGNNVDAVDKYMVDIVNHMDARLDRPNARNGRFQLGIASIDYHIRYGELTGATPDGRRRGEPLSKNIGASIGKDRSGLTALILSATKIDTAKTPGSAVLDFLVHPSAAAGEAGLDALTGMLRTFFKRGGYAIQGNVADATTLRDAQRNPGNYEGLQVRVTGWNWRFNDMTKDYQDEIIHRLEGVDC